MIDLKKLVWPDWMPSPYKDGYSYEPTDRRSKTEMEIGATYRVEYDADETVLHCYMDLDEMENAFFEAFEQRMLRQGATWFEMPIQTSRGVAMHRVRMRERPKYGKLFGAYTRVDLVLDVDHRNMLQQEEIEALYLLGPDGIMIISNALHVVVHTIMPGISRVPADIWPKQEDAHGYYCT